VVGTAGDARTPATARMDARASVTATREGRVTAEYRRPAEWLPEVLETIGEFGEASIGLVAWELCLPEQALAAAWGQATAQELIEPTDCSPETGEQMYRLAVLPHARR
jgi:hypothetical protein